LAQSGHVSVADEGLGQSFLQEPTLDHQAAVSLAEDMIRGLLKKLVRLSGRES
jgi:hypothetical protein